MKQTSKQLSIAQQVFWGSIVVGILWIIIGITDMFNNTPAKIIHIILLLSTVAIVIFLMRANCEGQDEMSDYNYMKAKARTRDLMHYVFCGAAIVSALTFGLLKHAAIDWPQVIVGIIFILMGIQDLITGIVFRRLEAE